MENNMEGQKPNILLVDDIEANIVALEALLSDVDCTLIRASSGNEALRQLLRRDFAVMLLDVQMPGMDGYEVARYARENPATRDVPIIFLTAMHENEPSVLRGYGSGAVDFLFKPVNAHVLRAKVRIFLELYMSRQALSQEILAHKSTLSELELSNTALRHFTDAASHDLRAPLRSIRAFLEALAAQAAELLDAQSSDYLQRSQKAAERMDSLLVSLLTYARLRKQPTRSEVDCGQVVEHVWADLAERISATNATLDCGALPKVEGDQDRLYQLFLNLISNAIKFRRPDSAPRVTVSATRRGNFWTFCVEDEGIGVGAGHRASIFRAFERLHEHSKFEGSGLGLAICQQIVEQHGGRIWMEPGQHVGARFCFELPERAATSVASLPPTRDGSST
jgi:two-component system, sensor histidine kinase and response regulator